MLQFGRGGEGEDKVISLVQMKQEWVKATVSHSSYETQEDSTHPKNIFRLSKPEEEKHIFIRETL